MTACFPTINTQWFNSVIGSITAASTPEELQAIINEAYGTVGLINSTIAGQLEQLTLIEALLVPPVTLPTMITWVAGMITYLEAQYAPYAKYIEQQAAIIGEVAAMTAAVEQAAANFPDVVINIPSVAPFCTL